MNWWMLFLGLVLIVVSAFLGFIVGGFLISMELVIPATITLQMVIPPDIAQLYLNYNYDHSETGKQIAKMFCTMYRLGLLFWKSRATKEYFIDALKDDSRTQIGYLHYMEQKLGVHLTEEKTK